MEYITVTASLGTRIVSAARMAVAMHLEMADRQKPSSLHMLKENATIGGTDRRVTDDPMGGNDE